MRSPGFQTSTNLQNEASHSGKEEQVVRIQYGGRTFVMYGPMDG